MPSPDACQNAMHARVHFTVQHIGKWLQEGLSVHLDHATRRHGQVLEAWGTDHFSLVAGHGRQAVPLAALACSEAAQLPL